MKLMRHTPTIQVKNYDTKFSLYKHELPEGPFAGKTIESWQIKQNN